MDIKGIVNTFPKLDLRRIKRQIEPYPVISIDIFDTLIKRDVMNEHDVFSLAEIYFNRKSPIRIKGFRRLRIEAEAEARAASHRDEVTISEIYKQLIGKTDEKGSTINAETAALLRQAEEWAERNVSVRNDPLYAVLRYCRKKGKRVILVSDMYFEKPFIEELLAYCDIRGYNELYLSSDIMLQKRSGSLFREVLHREGITADRIAHIGDHKISDFLVPEKLGIKAITIPKKVTNTIYLQSVIEGGLSLRTIRAFINNRVSSIEGHNKKIGYEIYGPLLYMFVSWLKEKLNPEKTILFFSRDCYVVKPAFERLTKKEDGIYFLASRRSLIIPALHYSADIDEVQKVIRSEPKQMTIEGLLKKLGMNVKDYIPELKRCGLSPETVVERDRLKKNKRFCRFYKTIEVAVKENADREYENFLFYWETLNCSKEIQIVDIGWRGTMQYCLNKLLPDGYSLKGFYLGVRKDALISDYEGFFLNGEDDFEKECFLASMTALIEIFFSAPHGSVKRYKSNGTVEYLPYECYSDKKSELLVREIQEGALQFVTDYSASEISSLLRAEEKDLFMGLKIMGSDPKQAELETFGAYPFQMGAGTVKAAAPQPLIKYVSAPRKFLYDFSSSNWKVAFLKKCMRVKLPYYRIFSLIYKHRR